MTEYRLFRGPAAATVYLNEPITQINKARLTLDWAYHGVYFNFEDRPDIIISIGPKTIQNDIDLINTDDLINIFKHLSFYLNHHFQKNSKNSDNALSNLIKICDLL